MRARTVTASAARRFSGNFCTRLPGDGSNLPRRRLAGAEVGGHYAVTSGLPVLLRTGRRGDGLGVFGKFSTRSGSAG